MVFEQAVLMQSKGIRALPFSLQEIRGWDNLTFDKETRINRYYWSMLRWLKKYQDRARLNPAYAKRHSIKIMSKRTYKALKKRIGILTRNREKVGQIVEEQRKWYG